MAVSTPQSFSGTSPELAGSAVIHTIRRNYKKAKEDEIASLWYMGGVI
jgi:hypothetical protein